jgi:hypothetical protein
MHSPLAEQHRWLSSVLRGHYGYYGVPHNYPVRCAAQLPGIERIPSRAPAHLVSSSSGSKPEGQMPELGCLQGNAQTLSLAPAADHSPLDGGKGMTRVTLGKSRMRESCTSGSVRAKAEWLSYSTVTKHSVTIAQGNLPAEAGQAGRNPQAGRRGQKARRALRRRQTDPTSRAAGSPGAVGSDRTAVVRTRMPGGVGGAAPRGVPLSRSLPHCCRSKVAGQTLRRVRKLSFVAPPLVGGDVPPAYLPGRSLRGE